MFRVESLLHLSVRWGRCWLAICHTRTERRLQCAWHWSRNIRYGLGHWLLQDPWVHGEEPNHRERNPAHQGDQWRRERDCAPLVVNHGYSENPPLDCWQPWPMESNGDRPRHSRKLHWKDQARGIQVGWAPECAQQFTTLSVCPILCGRFNWQGQDETPGKKKRHEKRSAKHLPLLLWSSVPPRMVESIGAWTCTFRKNVCCLEIHFFAILKMTLNILSPMIRPHVFFWDKPTCPWCIRLAHLNSHFVRGFPSHVWWHRRPPTFFTRLIKQVRSVGWSSPIWSICEGRGSIGDHENACFSTATHSGWLWAYGIQPTLFSECKHDVYIHMYIYFFIYIHTYIYIYNIPIYNRNTIQHEHEKPCH